MKAVTIAAAAFALASPIPPPAAADAQKLPGLWGSETIYGPDVFGALFVDARYGEWSAGIAGFEVGVQHRGRDVSLKLPGGQGEFRGQLAPDGREIRGEWIQRRGSAHDNDYATPVTLLRSAKQIWRGVVTPHPDRLSLYLLITKDAAGTLSAALRNPEFNLGRRGPYAVTAEGSHWLLVSGRNGADRMQVDYDPATDTITVSGKTLGGVFAFSRRDRDHARGFYPDTPRHGAYVYRPPLPQDDGWATGSLEEVGLDPSLLRALVQKILDTEYAGPHTPYVHSLLVARHHKLVLEQYFHGYYAERSHDTRSAGKTFAGVLLGIALGQGAKLSLESPVLQLFPEYKDIANIDARKRALRVRDLVTMTSGLSCDDDDDASPGNEDEMQRQSRQPDWYKYTLDLPMARDPGGSHAVYCSAGINLLGGVIRNATGTSLAEFFDLHYARPLDLGVYHLNLMPGGEAYMAGGIAMRPRDQLKLGQLYLDGGVWRGRRIVSESWVKASWQAHSVFGPGHSYGYAWHIIDLKSGGRDYRLYEAGGNGGQFIIAIPELDLVVGFTAGNYGDFGTWYKFMTDLVPDYVIPAASPRSH